jgi:TolB protein
MCDDGQQRRCAMAISAASPDSSQSQVYMANADGLNPRLITRAAPSYFHGRSPDGKYLAIIARRDGKQFHIYRVPATGGY